MNYYKMIITTMVTFVLFFIEAFLHFNIGKNEYDKEISFKISMPTKKELACIVAVLTVFSLLNGIISQVFIKYLT